MSIGEYTNTIKQGVTGVGVQLLYGNIETKIDLSMERGIDARGIINWLDNGKEYDNFSTSITLQTDVGGDLEDLLSNSSTDDISIVSNKNYPFTPVFDNNQDYPVNVESWSTEGNYTILGELRRYKMNIVPNVTDIYTSLTASGIIDSCPDDNHWQIGAIPFPFTDFKQVINDHRRVNVYGGSSSSIADTERTYGDVAEMTIRVEEDQARKILQFFTGVMRGTEQTLTMPAIYNIFGERYKGITSCKCKLYDSILTVSHTNYRSVEIKFKLQMTGV
jgi:hypothetical protein